MAEAGNTAHPQVTQRQVLTAGFASVVAWSLDLFDLSILLYVASTIAPLFFLSDRPTLSLAATYASYAVTLIMRPAGSAIFGNFADRRGRKRAMVIAVLGTGVVTALMGAVPTVHQIGLLAPILFLALRMAQGIFVGGVVASTHTLGTETVPERWRGLMSGLIQGGAGLGLLFASLALLVSSWLFPGEAFSAWGWRFMFFSGLITAVLSLFIYRAVQESPLWAGRARRDTVEEESPLKSVLSGEYRSAFLLSLVLVAGAGAQGYLTAGFLPAYLDLVNGIPRPEVSRIMVVSNLGMIVAAVLFGHLSEIFGRKRIFILLGVVNLLVIPFTYLRLADLGADSTEAIYLSVFVLLFLGNAAAAPLPVFLNERFPTYIRASGTALSWNIGIGIGGLMPTFVTLASPTTADIPSMVVIFIGGAIVLYLIGALLNPETRGRLL